MIKETTTVDPPSTENIPDRLVERRQWVCWCLEERKGELAKVPYTPGTTARASSTDLMTWRTFEEALEAYEASEPRYDGIGFVFCGADPFVGIDLDDCRDAQSGEVAPWAQDISPACRKVMSRSHLRARACTSSSRARFAVAGRERKSV